ncbi:hypothetical protein CEP54_016133 [Fusarium duplospermum]|uniref:Uncharacterized protein n=1 Tax=Fusarium duplospermum TaxID=1325734 RepID=A0A428NI19_9HYPO|nr:hypothetical protein CEP54_016133 [Fusarium duplospermum]
MIQLQDLSVGQVAGMVATGIFVYCPTKPCATYYTRISSGRSIHDYSIRCHLASEPCLASVFHKRLTLFLSRSVVSRSLHSSYWPAILRSNPTASAGQHKRVELLVWLTPIAKILLALAAILTPLGLYDSIVLSREPEPQSFHYAQDTSVLGFGTMPRLDFGINRRCGGYPFWACPGNKVNVSEKHFNPSVSSVFDIQWRAYRITRDSESIINNGSEYLVGDYRQLSTLLLNDRIEAVEGLIVDSHNGGIGFRNHSLPSGDLALGASWSEDILFIVPETQCVNTNLTIDFYTDDTQSAYSYDPNRVLTDRGGFANINRDYVYWGSDVFANDTQDTLDLQARAFKGAWLNNGLTMQYMNITGDTLRNDSRFSYLDSFVGKRFPLMAPDKSSTYLVDHRAINTAFSYGNYLPDMDRNSSLYENPFSITTSDFIRAGLLCKGQGGGDYANISNIAVSCGLVISMARLLDSPDSVPLSHPTGTNWTQPIYSCASAAKAIIKTVTFKYDGTRGLLGLNILNITDKDYRREEKPLWVVENTQRNLSYYDPLWGMTNSVYEGHANTSTLRKDSLWLPGYTSRRTEAPYDDKQNLPGVNFHTTGFSHVYRLPALSKEFFDYSGKNSLALHQKWFELTRNETGTAHMLNLIWTDVVTNAVVGTRGLASQVEPSSRAKRAGDSTEDTPVLIYVYERRVLFHYLYGIPAFIVCALALTLSTATVVLGLMRRTGLRKLDKYINQTSLGRSLVSLLHPEEFSQEQSKREWEMGAAKRQIVLGRERPLAAVRGKYDSRDDGAREGLLCGENSGVSNENRNKVRKSLVGIRL